MKYRKKAVVIEAYQMTFDRRNDKDDWPDWLKEAWFTNNSFETPGTMYYNEQQGQYFITTLEGRYAVSWDDWIIRGIQGELYPCKPGIFEAKYEAVPD